MQPQRPAVDRSERKRARDRLFGILVFIGLLLSVSFPYFERTRNANEIPRLVQGMALWEVGNFAIDGPVRRRLDLGPDIARSPVDGRLYPNKPPGVSIVSAGAFGVARAIQGDELDLRSYTWWARFVSGVVPTFLLAWFLLVRLTWLFGRGPAVVSVALYVAGTPAASYAHLAYGHQLAAALLTVGVVLCIDAVTAGPSAGRRSVMARGVLGGAMAAAAVAVEYGAVFAGLPLAVLLLLRLRHSSRRATIVVTVAAATVVVGLLAAYHEHAFGSPWQTGYHHVVNPEFAEKHGQGLLGLGWPRWDAFVTHMLAVDTGLLAWCPFAVVGIYGLLEAATHRDDPVRTETRVLAAVFVLYVVITTSLSFEGGWRVGPRYMVVALPALSYGWAEALSQIRTHPVWMFVSVTLALYGVVVNTLAANLWPHIDPTNIHHPVSEILLPLWDAGLEPYSVLRSGLNVDGAHLVVSAAVLVVALLFLRLLELRPANLVAFTAALLCTWALVASTRLWSPHPKSERNLAYIKRVWEPPPDSPRPAASRPLPPLSAAAIEAARQGPVSPDVARPR